MAFGGTIGPSGALIPANIIFNIKGELGHSYDADGRIRFQDASGNIYTPERVDTLFVQIAIDQAVPPLGALLVGNENPANADTGVLVTAAPAANQNGLPVNFGPGRGRWAGPTGQQRIRCEASETLNVVAVAAGAGSVVARSGAGPTDALVTVRNFHGEQLSQLTLRVSVEHSVQG